MTFQATLSGHVDTDTTEAGNAAARQVEQDIFDAIAAIVEQANTAGIVVHAVEFNGQWVQDTIVPQQPAPVDQPIEAPVLGGDGTPAPPAAGDPGAGDATAGTPTPAPAEFVAKIPGELYADYVNRVNAHNADPANAADQLTAADEATWTALPETPAPAAV